MAPSALAKIKSQSKMIHDLKKLNPNINRKSTNPDDNEFDLDIVGDDPYDLEDFIPEQKNQEHNKNVFRRNFGVESQIPGLYIIDAKIL